MRVNRGSDCTVRPGSCVVCLVGESAELKRHTFYTGAVLLTGVMAWGCRFLLVSDCIGTALNNLLSKKSVDAYSENWIFNLIFTGYCKKNNNTVLSSYGWYTKCVCVGD